MNLLSLLIIPFITFGGLTSKNNNVKNANENEVVLTPGSIFEAEDADYKNCSIINNNSNASGREALDAGDGGYVTFKFGVETAGNYDIVVGYYTDNYGAKIGVNVNGSSNSYPVKHTNGWCKDTKNYAIEQIVRDVELKKDSNEIKISSDNIGQSKYLNFDYIRLVETHKSNGDRIQFEDYYRYVGGDGYGRSYQVGENVDGKVFSLDDNISANPVYSVDIEKSGEYYVQIAYYSNSDATYKFKISNESKTFLDSNVKFAMCPGGFPGNNYFPYSAKHIMKVELEKGKVDFTMNYIKSGFIDFDWFRIYQVSDEINTVIEAEDVTYHDANINRSQNQYSHLSGYAVELAQGFVEFDVKTNKSGLHRLYIGGYTASTNAYLNISINGGSAAKFTIPDGKATGWSLDVTEKNVFYFDINLNNGKNTIKITKGGDEVALNYIDLDYFMVMPDRILIDKIELDNETKTQFIIDDNAIDFVTEYTLEIKNPKVAKLDGNVLSVAGKGSTVLFVKYQINGVDMVDEVPVLVAGVEFNDKSAFEVKNTTRTYNGERQFVDVVCPEGWTFTQTGDSHLPGTYYVQITFHHDAYLDYEYPNVATLTIVKAIYDGEDLFADDQSVYYDGDSHQYVASAPNGWTISYSVNDFVEVGEYEVTVTFSHEYYENVVKTAKFTVLPAKPTIAGHDAIPFIIAVSVIAGLAIFGGAGWFIYKKVKKDKEVIK